MIPVLSARQCKTLDELSILEEPVSSLQLMERAATAFTRKFCQLYKNNQPVGIFCGQGNNGGDGLAIARLLLKRNYEVTVYILDQQKTSPDFESNHVRLLRRHIPRYVHSAAELPPLQPPGILIDALFGTGLRKAPSGLEAATIQHMMECDLPIVSVDLPSGLSADKIPEEPVIRATHTLTFQYLKKTMLFPFSEPFTGKVHVLDIGLDAGRLPPAEIHCFIPEKRDVRRMLKPRSRYAHKGNFGHALLLNGSKEKMGAALLAAKACVLCGAGLTTAHLPASSLGILQQAVPEVMCSEDLSAEHFSTLPSLLPYTTVQAGCGLGTAESTAQALYRLLQEFRRPMVLDADALNLIASHGWMDAVPAGSILTPHLREFERLFGTYEDALKRHAAQLKFSAKYQVFILLKGANSCWSSPDGNAWFNPTGNPGMAKGGSGDVLSGMMAAFLAQGYAPFECGILAAYLHGMAGDLAAAVTGPYSLTASDLIQHLPAAFQQVLRHEE